ncbi:protease modulator HflC [Roseospirillum parvum]|uniref:Protein HflC n=1 Tax=Roseospirillum parvum TaxID=83401 RepID=A0A1G7WY70_9PROT|nr:protease modulator HflC [Roseospirillum parvum]SDG76834.1 membrane protease subunit HflC [Roseospirillum parvum]
MKNIGLLVFGVIAVVAAVILSSSLFTVQQTEQAIVLRFGNPVRLEEEPGLKFKVPMVETVLFYDNRILPLDPPVLQLPLADQKRINVDAFARFRIVDPLELYKTVRDENGLRNRFGDILNAQVRNQVAKAQLIDLLGDRRVAVMDAITQAVREQAPTYGIEVIDVRIGRTDLPTETSQSVFDRMRSEREAQARKLRSEGQELKDRIEGEANRDKAIILAEAERTAQGLRGEGDAERNRILGKAYGRDQEFFRFYRTLQAYREGIGDGGATLVLSPNSEFFRYFGQDADAEAR